MAYARSNPHRFTTTRAGKAEIDEEFNTQTGWINETSRRMDNIETSGISGADNPANAGKVPVTDGYHISWKKVDLSYLTPQSMTDAILQDRSITSRVMGVHSIGSDQLMDNCINEQKVPHNSLPGTKIIDHSLPLTKISLPTSSCLIGGAFGPPAHWYACEMNAWEVPTTRSGETGPRGQPLNLIWSNTVASFDGAKMTTNSLPGTSLSDRTVSGGKMVPYTITGYELASQAVTRDKIASQTITGDKIAAQTITGDKIANASIPMTKLSDVGIGMPFCAGFVLADGRVSNGFNVRQVVMKSSQPLFGINDIYTVIFERPARSTHYIVVATARSDNGPLIINVLNNTNLTTGQFELSIFGVNGQCFLSNFSFVVYQS